MRKYAVFFILVPFVFQTSAAGVGTVFEPVQNTWVVASDPKAAVAKNLERLADELAKKRLSAYVLNRYGDAPEYTRERFAANFAAVAAADPRAEIHPYYLVSLEKKLKTAPKLKEDGILFWAYVHILLSLREEKTDVSQAVSKRKEELQSALKNALSGDFPLSQTEVETAWKTLEALKINPRSFVAADTMRTRILEEKIGPRTPYFKAYALLRKKLLAFSGEVRIPVAIPHEKQRWNLSCEANSLRDLVNSYRIPKKETVVDEGALVFLLPSSPEPPRNENGVRIWADPSKEFVGKIDGRQSSNPSKLTGYGIHADGVLPYVRRELKRYGVRLEKGAFDSNAIAESLLAGHGVVFWYVLSTETSRGFSRLEWKTPEGKDVHGFVGQHTGIIVGGKFDDSGNLREVSYYEGKNLSLQTESFEALSRKAKWFNEALYATADESGTATVRSASKKPSSGNPQKIRKKNVRKAL